MAKQQLAFVALLVLQGAFALSLAAPKSSVPTAFEEWMKTFDPATAVASKTADCGGKPDGFYPADTPDTCSASYTLCVSGIAFDETCDSGEVFDSTVEDCVDRYAAQSDVCQTFTVPTTCTGNGGPYPTDQCSALYYRCEEGITSPVAMNCRPGLPDRYFDPITLICADAQQTTIDGSGNTVVTPVPACKDTIDPTPPSIPPYNCVDKIKDYAYPITACSPSFYTCDRPPLSSPTPWSCIALADADPGTVFDYKANPQLPDSALCVPKSPTDC